MGWTRKAIVAATTALVAGLLAAGTVAQAPPPGGACPIDVVLVLDRSNSMTGSAAEAARAGTVALVQKLSETRDQSGLRVFPNSVGMEKELDHDHEATATAATFPAAAGDGQDQAGAMERALDDLLQDGRKTAFRTMVVLSDGMRAKPDPMPIATLAKSEGIRIFSIAIGTAEVNLMRGIASEPSSVYFRHVTTSDEAVAATEDFMDTILDCAMDPDLEMLPGCAPGEVAFVDASTVQGGSIAQRHWDFGDGGTEATGHDFVLHTYDAPGPYNVTLRVFHESGPNRTVTKSVDVPLCPPIPPVAAFSCIADPTDAFRVRFVDKSQADGEIVAWTWDLGDGNGSTEQHPVHSYGTYEASLVRLDVTDDGGLTVSTLRQCSPRGNRPPSVSAPDAVVHAGQTVWRTARGYDMDGDGLEYTFSALPDAASVSGPHMKWRTGVEDIGSHVVGVEVDDGLAQTSTTFKVTVVPAPLDRLDSDMDGVPDVADPCPAVATRHTGDGTCTSPTAPDGPRPAAAPAVDLDDLDLDGIPDAGDNCRAVPNRGQADMDQDGRGDRCDDDADGDHVPDARDNCPGVPNQGQDDQDADGRGDLCDLFGAASPPPAARPASAAQPASAAPAAAVPSAGMVDAAATGRLAVGVGLGLLWALALVGVASARRR